MDIIKESPLCFTDGEEKEKAGNIYWDQSNSFYVYWTDDTTWQYVPPELADSVQNEINACTALVKENEKNRNQISGLKKDIRNAAGVAGALRDERDAWEKANKALGQDIKDALDTSKGVKKELRETTSSLGATQTDLKAAYAELERAGKTIKELEGATYDARMDLSRALDSVGALEREAKRMAEQVAELEAQAAEKSPALNPEDIMHLREACTVAEVLRMRAAGVL